jgi:hypothetical protein
VRCAYGSSGSSVRGWGLTSWGRGPAAGSKGGGPSCCLSSILSAEQLLRGGALRSQAQAGVAQEFEAKTLLLQSQLDYIQAGDEMTVATDQTPK